ncbi:MAG: tetratricopeptide repeat protein, partial [Planctomycetota bacterium]
MLDNLERQEEARTHYLAASDLWAEQLDTTDWEYLRIVDNLTWLEWALGRAAEEQHDWQLAEERFRSAQKRAQAFAEPGDYRTKELRHDLARVGRLRRMSTDQIRQFDETRRLDAASRDAADAGDFDQAGLLAQRRRDLVVELFGASSPDAVGAEFDVVWLMPDSEESRAAYESLAARIPHFFGEQHPTYGDVLLELARQFEEPDDAALARAKQAATIFANTRGKEHRDYVRALALQGRILLRRIDPAAEATLLEAKTRLEQQGETEDATYVDVLSDLASFYSEEGRPTRALPYAIDAVAAARNVAEYFPYELSTLVNELANAYYNIERYDEALELYVESTNLLRDVGDRDECSFRITLFNTGELFYARGEFAKAQLYYEELFDACASGPACNDACLDGGVSLAAALRRQQEYDAADRVLGRVEKLLDVVDESERGIANEYRARVDLQRAAILRDQSDEESARAAISQLWR